MEFYSAIGKKLRTSSSSIIGTCEIHIIKLNKSGSERHTIQHFSLFVNRFYVDTTKS